MGEIWMKRAVAIVLGVIVAGPLSAQGQIVIPDDSTQFVQQQPAPGGTGMTMRRVEVQGQKQLRGRYGSAWTAQEVREEAVKACAEGGLRLVYFQPGKTDARGWTEFAAVCQ